MDPSQFEVAVEQLRWRCDPGCFSFECTDELAPLQQFIGQDRAISAIEFGLGVTQPGYNIYVAGMPGTGRGSIIKAHLEGVIKERRERGEASAPSDWCYIHNFDDGDQPKILRLPAGEGRRFKSGLERLREDLRREVGNAFSGDEFETQRKGIAEENQAGQRALFQRLEQEARAQGFTVQFSPAGMGLLPLKDGRPLSPEDFLQLPEAERRDFESRRKGLMRRVESTMDEVRALEHETSQRLADLSRQVAEFATTGSFKRAAGAFSDLPQVTAFLDDLRAFAVEHVDAFREKHDEQRGPEPLADAARVARERQVSLPFEVNVFVDNSGADSPPIIIEGNPTFGNLFGKIDRRFVFGGYVTDHTLLKSGSINRANGGYLVLPMRQLLTNPLSWETLKRVIKEREVRPEDPAEVMGMVVPQSIKPEPMALDLKVVVTGDGALYNLLSAHDEDFWETFKVKADFDYQISRTPEHLDAYAAFICRVCNENKLRHFERTGVSKVVEYTARLVADQHKLSTRFGLVQDLLIEADYWARKEGAALIAAPHVEKALEQKVFRSNLLAERIRELIAEGTFMVDVSGEVVGQVNGLAVYDIGDYSFGRPSRITARTFLGRGGVVNIEREAKMSGKTHDKGVLILSGYLGWKYAQKQPLSMSATIAFEQSYGEIDGDSASSTEVYAILSSLADVPIKQGIAVTGSVNQKGEVQAIGGVNQKVEGFFDVCQAIGLTGDQGVLIPKQNVRNLMLREDVVAAVEEGRFHVYAVDAIDQGIEILTGVAFGQRDERGKYPESAINHRVEQRLREFAQAQRELARRNGAGADEEPDGKDESDDDSPPAKS